MARNGFEKSKSAWPLRRHALERREKGYDAFVQAMVSAEDWAYEQSLREASQSSVDEEAHRKSLLAHGVVF